MAFLDFSGLRKYNEQLVASIAKLLPKKVSELENDKGYLTEAPKESCVVTDLNDVPQNMGNGGIIFLKTGE
jgi:hypothetical protein